MVYFAMALALFADDDYEEVAVRLSGESVGVAEGPDGHGRRVRVARGRRGRDRLPAADGSYISVLVNPQIRGKTRDALVAAARAAQELDPDRAVLVRVVEYTVLDRTGDGKDELIALLTTILDGAAAPAQVLVQTYHDRWEHEPATIN